MHVRPPLKTPAMEGRVLLPEVLSALSFALDLTEAAVPGHAIRSCLLGMRLAHALRLPDASLHSLYYALLLKDIGCSSNAARMCQIIGGGDDRRMKAGAKLQDWTQPHKPRLSTLRLLWREVAPGAGPSRRVARILKIGMTQHANNAEMIQLRCERGASIVRKLGLDEATADAVRCLDEHWNGSGYPDLKTREAIPLLARIMGVAQHLDAFCMEGGPEMALRTLRERSGRWFDPEVVKLTVTLDREGSLWRRCMPGDDQEIARAAVIDLEPITSGNLSPAHIDQICAAFADVVDAKSPFTFQHSLGVSAAAVCIAEEMGLSPAQIQLIHRAALLHDIGKLSVPNSVLDKAGSLTPQEWGNMREHPRVSRQILERVRAFAEIAEVAGQHHERLNGRGYPDGLTADRLSLESRIVAVADVYSALGEDRPYRGGMDNNELLRMMQRDVPDLLDHECFEALHSMAAITIAAKRSSVSVEPGALPGPRSQIA